jgi:hypothetical protein
VNFVVVYLTFGSSLRAAFMALGAVCQYYGRDFGRDSTARFETLFSSARVKLILLTVGLFVLSHLSYSCESNDTTHKEQALLFVRFMNITEAC